MALMLRLAACTAAAAAATRTAAAAAPGTTAAAACLSLPGGGTVCHDEDGAFSVHRRAPLAAERSRSRSGGAASVYTAATTLGGCDAVPGTAAASVRSAAVGGGEPAMLRASRVFRCPNGLEATAVDTLTNSSAGVSWDVSVTSSSAGFWTAPIVSTVAFPGHTDERYWFGGSTDGDVDLGAIEFGKCDTIKGVPTPPGVCDFKYGGDYADPTTPPNEVWTNQLVLPIWSYYSTASTATAAVALVQSPLLEHVPVVARLRTHAGTFAYSRELSRLGNGSLPATFRQQLLHTAADWRPAAGWMLETYPEFFFPNASANIAHMEGAGAYADYRGVGVDAEYVTQLDRMNFGINWDAVFPYPFHGMWMPYAPYYGETWENCFIHPKYDEQPSPFNVTHAWIAQYYKSMEKIGFYSCTYANWFEFGWNISNSPPSKPLECSTAFLANQTDCDKRSMCKANELFWEHFEAAAVRQWPGGPTWPSEIPGKDDSHGKGSVPVGDLLRPTGCLGSPCALMDPGHEVYKEHLLQMGKTMITQAASSGLCVDRQDMVGGVINDRADDGRTYYTANVSKISAEGGGVVGRSSMFSVLDLLDSMGDLMHSAGKGIMVNTHTSRIDMFRNVDGVFDEHGDSTVDNMKVTALNTLAMPAVIWNHGGGNGDKYLQQHLYYGVNCMIPFPDNDHSIHDTDPKTVRAFQDYGPMFAQLRSKVWVLVAHAAEVTSGHAKANFFKTSLGNGSKSYAAPVMLADPNTTSVDVTLRCDVGTSETVGGCGDIPKARLVASVLHPGAEPAPLTVSWGSGGELIFSQLPLSRGCAMIVLRDSQDPPPPPGPKPLPPGPAPPNPRPGGSCGSGCKLDMQACNSSSPAQIFTYDGKHLHHTASGSCVDMNKVTLAVGLWSPCERVAEDDQWWDFALRNSSAVFGLLEMKGVTVKGKTPCLDASITASTACDATKASQQWALSSPKTGGLLWNAGGMCVQLSSTKVAPAQSPTTAKCAFSSACVLGVASTVGYFETNRNGIKQKLTCNQQWSTAISSNADPKSVHHQCPLSAATGGASAWQQPQWQACIDDVVAAGVQLNTSLCRPSVLVPHSLHSDLAVLQQGKPCFTGRGLRADKVIATVEQDATATQAALVASSAVGTVDADGYWKVCLTKPLSPSLLNHTVHFKGEPSGSVATNIGVLIGNVILCSGQSNMEKPVSYVFNATAEMAAAPSYGHAIRTLGVPGPWSNDIDGGSAAAPRWDTMIPLKWSKPSVYGFSAVCWMYGRRIYEAYPTTPVGGTAIEPWSPPDALAACGLPYRGFNNTAHVCPPFCNTSSLFNGMIAPLMNYSIHHTIWYQGESNSGDTHYGCSQKAMVASWRKLWGNDFPFGFVQLGGFGGGNGSTPQVVAQLRRQQLAASDQSGVFFAVAMDLADPAVQVDQNVTTDVHSRFKEQIGERLALGGRAVAFGEADVPWRGPTAVSAKLLTAATGAGEEVDVKFDNVGPSGMILKAAGLFELGSSSTGWQNATGKLHGSNSIIVSASTSWRALASGSLLEVRYAQYDAPCIPTNDKAGMSPGGGGEPGPATTGDFLAEVSCPIYSEYMARGVGEQGVLLPSPPFWLNVTR